MHQAITSVSHPLVKRLYKLRSDKSERQHSQSLVMMGDSIIKELSSHFIMKTLLIRQGFSPPFKLNASTEVYEVSDQILKKVSGQQSPQNMICELPLPTSYPTSDWNRLLILDGIQDPTNMGTIIRSALAMGFKEIYLVNECCDPFNDKALRGGRGATFFVNLHTLSSDEMISLLNSHNVTLYGAHMNGSSDCSFKTPCALVLGNEGRGISSSLEKNSIKVKIEMENNVESLNVAIAGSILMNEMRQANG